MRSIISLFFLAAGCCAQAYAQDARTFFNAQRSAGRMLYVWDSTGTNDGITHNGNGTWNKTGSNWTHSNGRANDYWRDGGLAVFGGNTGTGKAGIITLGIPVIADSIGFTFLPSGDFTLNGSTISGSSSVLPIGVVVGRSPLIASKITGNISLTKSGPGALTLTANNDYTGTTTISAGTLQIGTGGTSGKLPAGDIQCDGNLILNRSTTDTFNQTIVGLGSLTLQGSGSVRLQGVNNYTGGTIINAGTLFSGSIAPFGSGPVTVNNGAILDTRVTAGNFSVGNSVTVNPGGTWLKDGDGFFYNGSSLLTTPGTYTGALSLLSGTNSMAIQGTGNYGVSGNITGTGNLGINPGTNTITLSGNNTHTGTVSLFSGKLIAGSGTAFSSTSAYAVNPGAVMDLAGFSNTIGSLSGTGAVENSTGTDTLTAFGDNTSSTFTGILRDGASGVLAFKKAGSGTLTLGTAQTYSGGTILAGGTLSISTPSILPTGKISVLKSTNLINTTGAAVYSNAYNFYIDAGDTLSYTPNSTSSFTAFNGTLTGDGVFRVTGWGTTHGGDNRAFTGDFIGAGCFINDTISAFANARSVYSQGFGLNFPPGGTYRFSDINVISWGSIYANVAGVHTLVAGSSNRSNVIPCVIGDNRGTLAFVKEGTGTYRFTNTNSYSGGTTINGGKMEAGTASAFGTGPIVVNNGAILDTRVTAGLASIGNSVTVNPGGTWLKDADGLYLDATTLLSAPGTYSSALALSGGRFMNVVGSGTYDLTGNITGSVTLAMNASAGTIKYSGTNTYTGSTTLSGGTLQLASSSPFGSPMNVNVGPTATLDLAGNSISINSLLGSASTITNSSSTPVTFTVTGTAANNYGGVLQDGSSKLSFVKGTGTSSQGLYGASTFTGNVDVNGGTLIAGKGSGMSTAGTFGSLAVVGKTITVNAGATLQMANNDIFCNGTADLANIKATIVLAGGVFNSATYFSVVKDILLHSGGSIIGTNGVNTTYRSLAFCGTISSTGGDGTPSTISSSGVTGGIHLGNNAVASTGATFNIDSSGGGLIIYAPLYNRAANTSLASTLTKTGNGILSIRGANSYTGATTINQGILAVSGASPSSAHTVAAGAGISGGSDVTGSIGSLSFAAASARLVVNALSTTSASKLSCGALTAASGFTVDVMGPMNAGTYPILTVSSGSPTPALGINNSGRTVSFSWSGTTLNMTLL